MLRKYKCNINTNINDDKLEKLLKSKNFNKILGLALNKTENIFSILDIGASILDEMSDFFRDKTDKQDNGVQLINELISSSIKSSSIAIKILNDTNTKLYKVAGENFVNKLYKLDFNGDFTEFELECDKIFDKEILSLNSKQLKRLLKAMQSSVVGIVKQQDEGYSNSLANNFVSRNILGLDKTDVSNYYKEKTYEQILGKDENKDKDNNKDYKIDFAKISRKTLKETKYYDLDLDKTQLSNEDKIKLRNKINNIPTSILKDNFASIQKNVLSEVDRILLEKGINKGMIPLFIEVIGNVKRKELLETFLGKKSYPELKKFYDLAGISNIKNTENISMEDIFNFIRYNIPKEIFKQKYTDLYYRLVLLYFIKNGKKLARGRESVKTKPENDKLENLINNNLNALPDYFDIVLLGIDPSDGEFLNNSGELKKQVVKDYLGNYQNNNIEDDLKLVFADNFNLKKTIHIEIANWFKKEENWTLVSNIQENGDLVVESLNGKTDKFLKEKFNNESNSFKYEIGKNIISKKIIKSNDIKTAQFIIGSSFLLTKFSYDIIKLFLILIPDKLRGLLFSTENTNMFLDEIVGFLAGIFLRKDFLNPKLKDKIETKDEDIYNYIVDEMESEVPFYSKLDDTIKLEEKEFSLFDEDDEDDNNESKILGGDAKKIVGQIILGTTDKPHKQFNFGYYIGELASSDMKDTINEILLGRDKKTEELLFNLFCRLSRRSRIISYYTKKIFTINLALLYLINNTLKNV